MLSTWSLPVLATVVAILSVVIFSKVNKETYKPKYSPSAYAGKYTGLWDSKLCKASFAANGYNKKKQEKCLNIDDPSCSDFPMHYCSGTVQDNNGQNQQFCNLFTGFDAGNSCPVGFGMAYTPQQCEEPVLSTGQMYCSDDGGPYDCEKICDINTDPVEVDPRGNPWNFPRMCGSVLTTTADMRRCPMPGNRAKFGSADSENNNNTAKNLAIIILFLAVLFSLVFVVLYFRK